MARITFVEETQVKYLHVASFWQMSWHDLAVLTFVLLTCPEPVIGFVNFWVKPSYGTSSKQSKIKKTVVDLWCNDTDNDCKFK